jgi:3-dehydroquinate dehydratase
MGEYFNVIPLAISVIGAVISVSSFVLTRKDKSNAEVKEEQKQFSKHDLIEWRLDDITKKVDRILEKLDTYDKEMDQKIKEALKHHIAEYHTPHK